jgi:hypothetical protein
MEANPSTAQPLLFPGKLARTRYLYRQWMPAGTPALFFDRLVQDFGDFVHCRGLFSCGSVVVFEVRLEAR